MQDARNPRAAAKLEKLPERALMRAVFSLNAPVLTYNYLQTETGRSKQKGMMRLFEGAAMALCNPRAHGIINDHNDRAVEYSSFLCMLARTVETVQRRCHTG